MSQNLEQEYAVNGKTGAIYTTTIIGSVLLLILFFTNIIAHSIGIYLLRSIHKRGGGDVQQIYIINLSLVEIFICIINFSLNVLNLLPLPKHSLSNVRMVQEYATIVIHTMLSFVFYASMILVTLDKVFEVWLNIKYSLFCNSRKARYLVYTSWLIGFTIFLVIISSYLLLRFQYHKFNEYCFMTFDFLFLTTAVISYGSIFYKYKETRRHPAMGVHVNYPANNNNTFSVLLNSRFYISILLIVSFILFMVVPDFIYVLLLLRNEHTHGSHHGETAWPGTKLIEQVISMLYAFSFLVDACIYILMQEKVRKRLIRKFRKISLFTRRFTGGTTQKICRRTTSEQ